MNVACYKRLTYILLLQFCGCARILRHCNMLQRFVAQGGEGNHDYG